MNYVTPARHGRSAIGLSPDAVKWRYVHREDVPEYESAGWINADRYEKMRNKYFVLMLWEGSNGQH